MRFVYFDSESHLIKKGNLCPRLVCVSWAERMVRSGGPTLPEYGPGESLFYHGEDGISRGLLNRATGLGRLKHWLVDDEVTLCGHNVAYDFGVAIASAAADDVAAAAASGSLAAVAGAGAVGTSPRADELLRLVFLKYLKGLVRDTQVRAQLIDIATGAMKFHEDEDTGEPIKTSYHLADLSQRYLKKFLRKKDTWRLRYALLDGVGRADGKATPLAEWPEDAKKYAIDDAVTTLQVDDAMELLAGGPIPDAARQHRAAWALHLMSAWGVRTDAAAVAKLKAGLEVDYGVLTDKLRVGTEGRESLLNITPERTISRGPRKGVVEPEDIGKSTKRIQQRVAEAFASGRADAHAGGLGVSEQPPMTDPSDSHPEGQISTSKKTLLATGDPELKDVAKREGVSKLLNTYIPVLESGATVPITARYNSLVETGRTSCSKPNIQNPPRKGGVRECFIPRDGWVYAFSDYDTLELRALSQVCLDLLGKSEMAEALRRGEDLHYALAAEMNEISYAEIMARKAAGDQKAIDDRQFCKIPNFGFPGGLSAPTFIEYAAQFDYVVSLEKAQSMRELWLRRWPEMRDYFDLVSQMSDSGDPVRQLRSGRVRGGATYCAIANGFFQGLAADGSKAALWAVCWESYVGTRWDAKTDAPSERDGSPSPLYGTRPVFFIHDEIGSEIPWRWWGPERSAAAAERLGVLMVAVMEQWIPDIPILAKPVMCRRWYKGVERVTVPGADGVERLVPARPVLSEVDGKKKTVWVADVPEERAA